jgi:hypothetical protein
MGLPALVGKAIRQADYYQVIQRTTMAGKTHRSVNWQTKQHSHEVQRMKTHIGSDFDEFLSEQGLSEEVSATALKRVIAWQIAEETNAPSTSKNGLAAHMSSSSAAVDRTLVKNDDGIPAATKHLPDVN